MIRLHASRAVLCACIALIAGCKGGGGTSAAATPGTANVASTSAPAISGSTTTTIKAHSTYTFSPTASDPNGDALSFQIQNKPSWATFNTLTGQLSGTPTVAHIGTYANIVISASDGSHSTSLPAFTLTVDGASPTGVTVTWIAPTENVDGTALTDLAGFVVAYGSSRDALTQTIRIDNPSIDTYVLDGLAAGTWYFGVKAFSSDGAESTMSTVASKTL